MAFSGVTPVGRMSDSVGAQCAASYFAGYVALKLQNYHLKHLKSPLADCSNCCNIFTAQDLNLHMFVSFKEYEDSVDSS